MHKFPGMITIFSTLINYVEFCASKTSGGKKCLVFPEILFFQFLYLYVTGHFQDSAAGHKCGLKSIISPNT